MARLHPPDGGRKLTQVEIARKLGKPRSYTFKVENAERELNVIELLDYCEALGVDFFEFMRDYLQEVESLRKTPQLENIPVE